VKESNTWLIYYDTTKTEGVWLFLFFYSSIFASDTKEIDFWWQSIGWASNETYLRSVSNEHCKINFRCAELIGFRWSMLGWNTLGNHNSLRYFADALAKNHVRRILPLSIRYLLVLFPLDLTSLNLNASPICSKGMQYLAPGIENNQVSNNDSFSLIETVSSLYNTVNRIHPVC